MYWVEDNAYLLKWLIWPRPSTRTPAPEEINYFSRPFLCHHYGILSLSDPCLGVRKKIFRKLHQFYPKIILLWGLGSWSLQFLVSLSFRCYIPNLVKIGPVNLEKTHDERHAHNNGRQLTAISRLSDSVDLIIVKSSRWPYGNPRHIPGPTPLDEERIGRWVAYE